MRICHSGTRMRRLLAGIAVLAALCAGLLASSAPAFATAYVPINGAGSTWSYNAIHDWMTQEAQIGLPAFYSEVGSTTGRSEFAQGTVDYAVSELPYGLRDGNNSDPPPSRGYAYVPATAGAVTLAYNLNIGGQQVTNLRLSGAVIAGIFTGVITSWDDPRIAADNPGLTLPAIRIIPVVRSDGSGATEAFTQWLAATQPSAWNAYCAAVGRSPCTATSAYPVLPGSDMIAQPGDLGVTGYVSQAAANGAIGYAEYSFALDASLPVANVLNAAGYYTAPTPDNVGVSLLHAQVDLNQSDPLYGTAELSAVYTSTDPRIYELSYYDYMIVPTDTSNGFSSDKGYTLGAFAQYMLCQGQQQVNALGYAALPLNLVEEGYNQLTHVPGASLPASATAFLQGCANPTFASDGSNTLDLTAPDPPACDQQGPSQCGSSGGGTPLPVGSAGVIGVAVLAGLVLFVTQARRRRLARPGHEPARYRRNG